jgi:two-component system KDP operon response regulator KdpE
VRVALRHAARGGERDGPLRLGDVTIDLARRTATRAGAELHFTPVEYRLLTALARLDGRLATHRHLLRDVWGPDHVDDAHYLRVYMKQLRRKIESDPAQPRFLLTETGVGYRLNLGSDG